MRRILVVLVFATMFLIAQSHDLGQKRRQARMQTRQVSSPTAQQAVELNARNQSGRAFTREEKAQLISRLLANPRLAESVKNQRTAVLSVALASNDKVATVQSRDRRIAQVVLFNYTKGTATRLLVDSTTAEILSEEPVRGRPQPSEEEIQEADAIIRQDRSLLGLLENKAVLEGGFAVDGPPGTPRNHRFIQRLLLTSDRLRLQRVVVVDLTSRTIVSSQPTY